MSVSLKEAGYLIIVASFALSVNFFGTSIGQLYWIIWAALILSLLCLQNNFKFYTYRILVTGFVSALLVLLQTTYFTSLPWLPIFLGLITLLAIFYGQRYPDWFLPALIVNICVLLSAFYPAINEGIYVDKYFFPGNIARAIFIMEGALIVWLPQLVLWKIFSWNPHKILYDEFCTTIALTLNIFRHLNEAIFACFLEPEYQENIYLFERRIHVQRSHIIESIVLLRKLSKLDSMTDNMIMRAIDQLDLLFDLALDYAQLRRRVTDNTIFAVCFTELTAVRDEIDKLLADMISTFPSKKYHLSPQGLLEKINRFEEVYQNVLQVTSREPLVFLIFIASLKKFCSELTDFSATLLAIRGKD